MVPAKRSGPVRGVHPEGGAVNHEALRAKAETLALGAPWGEGTEAGHLAKTAMEVVAPVYEEAMEALQEEIAYLKGRVSDLNARMDRIYREAVR